jgi:hypothetical protein
MLLAHLTIFKQGSHFERCGVKSLGSELQCRGISLHAQWGAQGIVYVIIVVVMFEVDHNTSRPEIISLSCLEHAPDIL